MGLNHTDNRYLTLSLTDSGGGFNTKSPISDGSEVFFTMLSGSRDEYCAFRFVRATGTSVLEGEEKKIVNVKSEKVNEIISHIQRSFSLNKSDLAEVCGTTRKTIYNWVDGSSYPNKSSLERLFKLKIIADTWVGSGFRENNTLLRQTTVRDKSVFDLLTAPNLDHEKIVFAGSSLKLSSLASAPKKIKDPFAK